MCVQKRKGGKRDIYRLSLEDGYEKLVCAEKKRREERDREEKEGGEREIDRERMIGEKRVCDGSRINFFFTVGKEDVVYENERGKQIEIKRWRERKK